MAAGASWNVGLSDDIRNYFFFFFFCEKGFVVKSSFLEIFSAQLGKARVSCSHWTCFEQEIGSDGLWRSLPSQVIL